MGHTPRQMEFTDLPSIHYLEGRHILGIGIHKWRRQWEQVFQYEVKHWRTTTGIKVNLESLIAAFYPATAKDDALRVRIAHDYMWQVIQRRTRDRIERQLAKMAKTKDGEGT